MLCTTDALFPTAITPDKVGLSVLSVNGISVNVLPAGLAPYNTACTVTTLPIMLIPTATEKNAAMLVMVPSRGTRNV